MLRHYLRTTFRVLLRQASFSAINLIGLSVGIAAALLMERAGLAAFRLTAATRRPTVYIGLG